RRLERWAESGSEAYSFRCTGPCVSGMVMIGSGNAPPGGAHHLSSPKALLARHCLSLGVLYRDALNGGTGVCMRCGNDLIAGQWLTGDTPPEPPLLHGMYMRCPRCDLLDGGSPWHLGLDTPEAQRFWRRYPR